MGNLDAKQDWGDDPDNVRGMWLMPQQREGGDYVLATGETHSVREFVECAFAEVGRTIRWERIGVDERRIDAESRTVFVYIDQRRFSFADLVKGMVEADVACLEARR